MKLSNTCRAAFTALVLLSVVFDASASAAGLKQQILDAALGRVQHDPNQCVEDNDKDGDCCAFKEKGSCRKGYSITWSTKPCWNGNAYEASGHAACPKDAKCAFLYTCSKGANNL